MRECLHVGDPFVFEIIGTFSFEIIGTFRSYWYF
jgi:hypothetical protein